VVKCGCVDSFSDGGATVSNERNRGGAGVSGVGEKGTTRCYWGAGTGTGSKSALR
jgi:hypothetical protein